MPIVIWYEVFAGQNWHARPEQGNGHGDIHTVHKADRDVRTHITNGLPYSRNPAQEIEDCGTAIRMADAETNTSNPGIDGVKAAAAGRVERYQGYLVATLGQCGGNGCHHPFRARLGVVHALYCEDYFHCPFPARNFTAKTFVVATQNPQQAGLPAQ